MHLSKEGQRQYRRGLRLLFDYLKIPRGDLEERAQVFLDKARGGGGGGGGGQNNQEQLWTQDNITYFLVFHKERVNNRELAPGTLKNFCLAIKLFCDMHDLTTLNWKRITRVLPKSKSSSDDRAPTLEEIRKLVEYPDRRIKPLVYTMCSSGIRVGAWNYLRWKHVTAITDEKTGKILAAKLLVYAGEPEEYYSFITIEAYNSLKDWMDFRASYGENITGESWLMRNIWRTADIKRGGEEATTSTTAKGGRVGLVTQPKKLASNAIQKLLSRALSEQGIRPHALPKGVRRHEWKGAHGFRKFFETRATEAGLPFIHAEFLMGHSLGLPDSYIKPIQDNVLEHYLKAAEDKLTINYDNDKATLQKQVAELTEKSKEKDYIIRGRLAEKERELEEIKAQQTILQANMGNVLKFLAGMEKEIKIHAWDVKDGPFQTAAKIIEDKKKRAQARD